MKKLSAEVINFLEKQEFVIVSSFDIDGGIHCSAKGIAGVDGGGKVFLIDIYKGKTSENLRKNQAVSITAIDAHLFMGFTLQGVARILERDQIEGRFIKRWEEKVVKRISQRVIKHIKDERKMLHHPEAKFPQPQHLIEIDVENIVDLTPHHLKPSA